MPNPDQQRAIFNAAVKLNDSGREIIVSGKSLSDKIRAELMGKQSDPVKTPLGDRYVSPGHVLVEWIGDTSPLANDQIIAGIRTGLIPRFITNNKGERVDLHVMLQRATRHACNRWDGVSRRVIGEIDGFSKTITWGAKPGSYIQELTYADADRLFSSPSAHEFRYFENGETYEFPRDPLDRLPPAVRDKVRKIQISIGNPEGLRGMHDSKPGVGYWS